MVDKVAKIWMDGEFVGWDDAKVHVLTHSLHYGLGRSRAFALTDAPTATPRSSACVSTSSRLLDSCKLCYLKCPLTRVTI